jgi:omega-amidase
MRLGLLQFAPTWEDPSASKAEILRRVGELAHLDLLVLPEMCLTGFSMDPDKTQVSGEDHEFFAALCRSHRMGVAYCVGDAGEIALFLRGRDGQLIGRYAKRHLFVPGGEADAYQSGETVPEIWEFEGWRILPSLCYDLRFPYQFWSRSHEYDLILLPANWPTARLPHWRTLLAARAIENQAWVVGVNRVGDDPKTRHSGHSMVVDPVGQTVLEAGTAAGLSVSVLEHAQVEFHRKRFPAFADRRE